MKFLKKYKISLVYIIVLALVNLFHFQFESLSIKLTGKNFMVYLIYGLFLAFFLVRFIQVILAKKNLEAAVLLLIIGLIFFFLFSRNPLLAKLGVLEFFILGVLVSLENKKAKSFFPIILIIAAAFLVEAVDNFTSGGVFYYLDAWINVLTGLSGYIACS